MDVELRHDVHTGRHEHGRPVDRVESQNVLGHEMVYRWPPGIKTFWIRPVTNCCCIVNKCVVPHVKDVFVIPRDRNTPVDRGPGHRHIVEA